MMYTSMLWAALTPLLWTLPFLILVALFRAPHLKGWFGERRVSWVTRRRLDPSIYHLLNNLTLPDGAGTTQIVHVLVSRYGMFVIETKNYSGWVFGRPHNSNGRSKFIATKAGFKIRFQNPLHQNYKHLKTLETTLGLRSEQLHGIVVMVDRRG
ncbi:nuclease-related domain-containing protein [Pseudomonas asuensis]|uniref:NERD domain-containing protein n=1 Tax=Pseudomonas asuensis TaxID=1825787 RepID=A0ABQ2H555_9PSED|nr:nuclease-related domain-containing protein [Pseudomonas asuensis]GGM32456.1 hypothetical protein GCM10009425_48680 [Pseudomonas asuensis]